MTSFPKGSFIAEQLGADLTDRAAEIMVNDTPEVNAYLQLRIFGKVFNESIRANVTRLGVTNPSYINVLFALSATESMTARELRNHALAGASNMTSLIDRMERDGLVRRTEDPGDRRRAPIELTDQGQEIVRSISKPYVEWITSLFADFSEKELAELEDLLAKLWARMVGDQG